MKDYIYAMGTGLVCALATYCVLALFYALA
jgi:hypothetical protein